MPTNSNKPEWYRHRIFMINVFYEGPWERLCNFCWGIKKGKGEEDDSFRWTIGRNPRGWRRLLKVIADWAEERDQIWAAKYAIRKADPPKRWKRRA